MRSMMSWACSRRGQECGRYAFVRRERRLRLRANVALGFVEFALFATLAKRQWPQVRRAGSFVGLRMGAAAPSLMQPTRYGMRGTVTVMTICNPLPDKDCPGSAEPKLRGRHRAHAIAWPRHLRRVVTWRRCSRATETLRGYGRRSNGPPREPPFRCPMPS